MIKGNGPSRSTFWACLLVALTHIVTGFCQTQFSDDSHPPIIKDITVTFGTGNETTGYPVGLAGFDLPSITEFPSTLMVTAKLILGTHSGTHVVSPGHAAKYYGNISATVDKLSLATLNGPVLVVDAPRNTNITAQVLQSLNLPVGLKRVIFRTNNTDRKLIGNPALVTDYTGLTADGATWLAQSTTIEFVGIDYVSVAVYDDRATVYENLFAKPGMVSVEYLKLDEIKPGPYTVYCLPLRIEAVGSPARCILVE